jgi:hypothetical protein
MNETSGAGASTTVDVVWLSGVFNGSGLSGDIDRNLILKPNHALYNDFGVASYARITPWKLLLTPRATSQLTRPHYSGRNAPVKPPFTQNWPHGDLALRQTSANVYPGHVMIAQQRARWTFPFDEDLLDFNSQLRRLRSPVVLPLATDLMHGLSENAFQIPADNSREQKYFLAEVRLPVAPSRLETLLERAHRDIIASLIGAENPEYLTNSLVDRVLENSKDLNTKASSEFLLVNRQGAILFRPKGSYQGPHQGRFDRLVNLADLALYARVFLREGHVPVNGERRPAERWLRRIQQWVDYPDVTFDTSVSHTLHWTALMRSFLLKERVNAWHDYHSHDSGLRFIGKEHRDELYPLDGE